MSDLISRQDAIDAIKVSELGCEVEAIEALPSAQPEIIRCKDCRWGREPCGGNIECFADINEPPEYHGYEWFCPNGERRIDGVDS